MAMLVVSTAIIRGLGLCMRARAYRSSAALYFLAWKSAAPSALSCSTVDVVQDRVCGKSITPAEGYRTGAPRSRALSRAVYQDLPTVQREKRISGRAILAKGAEAEVG
jgi:hypothetical protein